MAYEPAVGIQFIKQKMPELTNLQAEMAFYALALRDAEGRLDTVSNKTELDEAYEQYTFWKALQGTDKEPEEAHYLNLSSKKSNNGK